MPPGLTARGTDTRLQARSILPMVRPPCAAAGPTTTTMDSEDWNFQYSFNMPRHPTARDATGWEFNFPPRDGVHYLVHPVIGRLGSRISATFVIERVDV